MTIFSIRFGLESIILTFLLTLGLRLKLNRIYTKVIRNSFREMLPLIVSKTNIKFTVFICEPIQFLDFLKVCELYGLSGDPNPSIDVYPVFQCDCVDTKNEKYKEHCENF